MARAVAAQEGAEFLEEGKCLATLGRLPSQDSQIANIQQLKPIELTKFRKEYGGKDHLEKILRWLQCKFSGKQERRIDVGASSTLRTTLPEFIDSLPLVLAIGTFGSDELNEDALRFDSVKNISSSSQIPVEFTPEEVTNLRQLLSSKTKYNDGSKMEQYDEEDFNADLSSDNKKIVLNRAKDSSVDNCNMIKQKSVSFLLKKMFVCRSGFAVTQKFKDPVVDSRMEKFFKALLHKKVYPQHSAPIQTSNYIEKNMKETTCFEDEMHNKTENGGQWIKSDSEYIVLEMRAAGEV
ncbi:hypothetical protein Cni_G15267 [Canna indica]|uniref:Uncharacterized protein n=1 Tax=Canna indica TaxID=4628 RepID=A0AAQ3KGL1_9LILI|nr:hypothetical protein Cni_G15267 [Canna indica]